MSSNGRPCPNLQQRWQGRHHRIKTSQYHTQMCECVCVRACVRACVRVCIVYIYICLFNCLFFHFIHSVNVVWEIKWYWWSNGQPDFWCKISAIEMQSMMQVLFITRYQTGECMIVYLYNGLPTTTCYQVLDWSLSHCMILGDNLPSLPREPSTWT